MKKFFAGLWAHLVGFGALIIGVLILLRGKAIAPKNEKQKTTFKNDNSKRAKDELKQSRDDINSLP